MADKTTAQVSRRWAGPVRTGDYWTARLTVALSPREVRAGLESVVFGPDAHACAREAHRQDRVWCEFPLRTRDRDGARRRLAFLAGADDTAGGES
ncbi:hypothetical protein [Actinomadura sp. SCN-SB]|uniref:hypothetical protein n=1 Tax=Actinomadura sp. SCN-SB TaxID=3373092 RepID=UPI0037521A34